MPCTVLHGTGHSYFYQMDYIVQISHIRTGIGVLHIAAQLKQHLIQRVGGAGLDLSSQGLVGLLAQDGAAGGVGLGQLLCVILIQQGTAGGLGFSVGQGD